MRTRAWWTLCCLVAMAAACSDQTTEPAGDAVAADNGPGTVASAVVASGDGLHIATDKDDYLPGDTVRFTGGGWPARDTLDILLEDEPATHEPHRWAVEVDASGGFVDSTYVVDQADLGVTFTLTATSRATGQTLALSFTDGLPQSLALSPATVAVLPGTSAQYLATVGMGGSSTACTVTMEMLTALPAGISAVVQQQPVHRHQSELHQHADAEHDGRDHAWQLHLQDPGVARRRLRGRAQQSDRHRPARRHRSPGEDRLRPASHHVGRGPAHRARRHRARARCRQHPRAQQLGSDHRGHRQQSVGRHAGRDAHSERGERCRHLPRSVR